MQFHSYKKPKETRSMADLNGFDANEVEPNAGFDPIPAGKYAAVITESENLPTKAGTGEYLKLTFQIIEGEHQGRQLWDRLNLKNPNPTAVQIARGDLSSICRAVGVLLPQDSVDLHNLPLLIHVRCKKRKDTEEIVNEIKGYSKKDSAPQATGAASNSTPPWKRN